MLIPFHRQLFHSGRASRGALDASGTSSRVLHSSLLSARSSVLLQSSGPHTNSAARSRLTRQHYLGHRSSGRSSIHVPSSSSGEATHQTSPSSNKEVHIESSSLPTTPPFSTSIPNEQAADAQGGNTSSKNSNIPSSRPSFPVKDDVDERISTFPSQNTASMDGQPAEILKINVDMLLVSQEWSVNCFVAISCA